jgi:hypothetical protein
MNNTFIPMRVFEEISRPNKAVGESLEGSCRSAMLEATERLWANVGMFEKDEVTKALNHLFGHGNWEEGRSITNKVSVVKGPDWSNLIFDKRNVLRISYSMPTLNIDSTHLANDSASIEFGVFRYYLDLPKYGSIK